MNLSKREKLLGGAVALILLLFVGNYLWESIKKGFVDKQDKIASLQKNRDDLKKGGPALEPVAQEPVEPEFVPEERERRTAEPTAASVFGDRS
jgi:hypothetical protein